ncbi:MoaD/ThiS family protein [Paraglaciecola aestuariivivens]
MLKILFFGQIKASLNTSQLTETKDFKTVAELRQHLQNKSSDWSENLAEGKALVAVNQTMGNNQTRLSNNDEVAFFPPVTGG